MRTSILGCYQFEDINKVKENTLQICKVTHASPKYENVKFLKLVIAVFLEHVMIKKTLTFFFFTKRERQPLIFG